MTPHEIAARVRAEVADGLHVEVEDSNRIVIYTPFMYRDGDHCSFTVTHDHAKDQWQLTDEGDVLARAGYAGVNLLAKDRVASFRQTIKLYGVRERQGQLLFPIEDSAFGKAIFSFSQACLDIIQLAKLPPERKA